MPTRFLLPLATLVILTVAGAGRTHAAGTQTYVLDPIHTQVVFFADHLGFSHAIGRLRIKQGWFLFDPRDWSTARADVVIDIGSLDMGEPGWSEKVRSAQFLGAEQWPTARFIGSTLEKTSDHAGILHGQLWLRGVQRTLDLDVTFNRAGGDPYAFKTKAGFSARARLDRFDFGMQTYRDVVAGPVELRIEVEGIRSAQTREESEVDAAEKQ